MEFFQDDYSDKTLTLEYIVFFILGTWDIMVLSISGAFASFTLAAFKRYFSLFRACPVTNTRSVIGQIYISKNWRKYNRGQVSIRSLGIG